MQRKLLAVFAFVLLFLVILLVRITYIISTKGKTYAKQVLSQNNYDSQTIPYRRGEILDRNGAILAKSDRYYNLILDCYQVNSGENGEYIEPTIKALNKIFNLDESELRDLLTNEETKDSRYRVLLKKLDKSQKEAFEEYTDPGEDSGLSDEELKERANVRGVWFETDYVRKYPYDSLACGVIGFSNDAGDGITGIENYYDDLLSGTNGRTFGYLNSDDEYEKKTIEPEHGMNLVTTIDMNIQEIVEKYIAEFDATYGDESTNGKGAENVAVLVMDPNTGEILAMADNSGYDLNDPYDLSEYYTEAQTDSMSDEEFSIAAQTIWNNYCISDSYEPGSVFKPITIASALQVGAVKDGDMFYCDGGEQVLDYYIRCDNIYGHGEETLEYALVNSCNDALMQIASKMGVDNFYTYMKLFNFGSQTGIDLPGETTGMIFDKTDMREAELATSSFGQGFTCSMIQEAAAFSAVINGGYYYQPHILKQVQSADGTVIKTETPLLLKQPISTANSSLLRQYLTKVVQEGTGRRSQVPGYLTGGKTGTAEKFAVDENGENTGERDSGKYLVSFIGACPMDDPQVVIYVVIDEPNVEDQADSTYPQVMFRKIATEVFPYLGLYPTEEVTQELLTYLGLTEEDIVDSGNTNLVRFDAFDSSGTYYKNCYVKDGTVVNEDGEPVEGATIRDDGTVVDGYGNEVSHVDVSDTDSSGESTDSTGTDSGTSGSTDTTDTGTSGSTDTTDTGTSGSTDTGTSGTDTGTSGSTDTDLPEGVSGNVEDPVADNPDIASPPQIADENSSSTSWSGVTSRDLEN